MRKLLKLTLVLIVASCSSQPKTLSEIQYTEKYLEHISNKYPKVHYEIKEPLVLKASYGEGQEVTHYLENSYREYKLQPKDLEEIIERYTDGSADLYDEKQEINVYRIVPVVKPADYFEEIASLGRGTKDFKVPELVWEEYNEDLIIVYAEDREKNIHYFNQDEFKKLNIARDTLREFSLNNLSEVIPKIELVGADGYFGLLAGGDYETSLILMTGLWTKENFEVDGEIVIAIPNRDLVFITGSNDTEAIKRLKETSRESYETGNHSLSASLYKWNGLQFVKL